MKQYNVPCTLNFLVLTAIEFFIIICLVSGAKVRSTKPAPWFNCYMRRDTNFPHPHRCDKYISCSKGEASEVPCPPCNEHTAFTKVCPEGVMHYHQFRRNCQLPSVSNCRKPKKLDDESDEVSRSTTERRRNAQESIQGIREIKDIKGIEDATENSIIRPESIMDRRFGKRVIRTVTEYNSPKPEMTPATPGLHLQRGTTLSQPEVVTHEPMGRGFLMRRLRTTEGPLLLTNVNRHSQEQGITEALVTAPLESTRHPIMGRGFGRHPKVTDAPGSLSTVIRQSQGPGSTEASVNTVSLESIQHKPMGRAFVRFRLGTTVGPMSFSTNTRPRPLQNQATTERLIRITGSPAFTPMGRAFLRPSLDNNLRNSTEALSVTSNPINITHPTTVSHEVLTTTGIDKEQVKADKNTTHKEHMKGRSVEGKSAPADDDDDLPQMTAAGDQSKPKAKVQPIQPTIQPKKYHSTTQATQKTTPATSGESFPTGKYKSTTKVPKNQTHATTTTEETTTSDSGDFAQSLTTGAHKPKAKVLQNPTQSTEEPTPTTTESSSTTSQSLTTTEEMSITQDISTPESSDSSRTDSSDVSTSESSDLPSTTEERLCDSEEYCESSITTTETSDTTTDRSSGDNGSSTTSESSSRETSTRADEITTTTGSSSDSTVTESSSESPGTSTTIESSSETSNESSTTESSSESSDGSSTTESSSESSEATSTTESSSESSEESTTTESSSESSEESTTTESSSESSEESTTTESSSESSEATSTTESSSESSEETSTTESSSESSEATSTTESSSESSEESTTTESSSESSEATSTTESLSESSEETSTTESSSESPEESTTTESSSESSEESTTTESSSESSEESTTTESSSESSEATSTTESSSESSEATSTTESSRESFEETTESSKEYSKSESSSEDSRESSKSKSAKENSRESSNSESSRENSRESSSSESSSENSDESIKLSGESYDESIISGESYDESIISGESSDESGVTESREGPGPGDTSQSEDPSIPVEFPDIENPSDKRPRPPRPGRQCDPATCQLEPYNCTAYQRCNPRIKQWEVLSCSDGLYFNPFWNEEMGGSCDKWWNLDPDVQDYYRKDKTCFPGDCYFESSPCSSRYFYHPKDTDSRIRLELHCPPGLVWSSDLQTCDFCYHVIDRRTGNRCDCY